MQHHLHAPHLQRQHYTKITVTTGCLLSSCLCAMFPGLETQAIVISVVTNIFWIWS